jgi:hypothetical protein
VLKHFPSHKLLDYAIAVETVTTSKKDNLILNVDGCIAVCFVDLLREGGSFSAEEAEQYLSIGILNGLFVLGRSIGLIAHFLDQKRVSQAPMINLRYMALTSQIAAHWSVQTSLGRHQYVQVFPLLCESANCRTAYLLPTLGKTPGNEGRVEVSTQ